MNPTPETEHTDLQTTLTEIKGGWSQVRDLPATVKSLQDQLAEATEQLAQLRRQALFNATLSQRARLPGSVSDECAREIAARVILHYEKNGRLEAICSAPAECDKLIHFSRSVLGITTRTALTATEVPLPAQYGSQKVLTNGLSAGDLLFGNGNPGGIGWLSADGTTSNLNWIVITNEPNLIESIYVDQTGIWSNDVLAVSGADARFQSITNLNVWRVHLRTNAQIVASIPALHLEGLLTLSNDTRYGPWAGKLLTADENTHAIFALDPSGSVSNYLLGIDADAIRLIPTNQDLYCVHFRSADSRLVKVSRQYFIDSVGDILFEQAGETLADPTLFVAHWNGTNFDVHGIDLFTYFPNDGFFEKPAFAPVSMPPVQ